MLDIRQVKHLLMALKTSGNELDDVLVNQHKYIEVLRVRSKGKVRQVLNVRGALRRFQKVLYNNVLLPNLTPSVYSHGGVTGRSILTNVNVHIGQRFLFTTDVSDFYPSIHYKKVYRLFLSLGCSPDVSSLCTKLTTYRHHLALGLITSPILADQLLVRADKRIGEMCERNGMKYTRFVDDVSISASFDLRLAGFASLVERILNQEGFRLNHKKDAFGQISDGIPITKLRIVAGHPDVQLSYLGRVWRDLLEAERLSKGLAFRGRFLTESQLIGKIRFIAWVNPSRKHKFFRKYESIDWKRHSAEAANQGILLTLPQAEMGGTRVSAVP